MTDITIDSIHAMIIEYMEHETRRIIAQATTTTDFVRAPGGISSVTAKDLIELRMDAVLAELPAPAAIETLGHLQAMRSVAERIEMGNVTVEPIVVEQAAEAAPKAKTTRRRKAKAQEPVAEVTPEPAPEEREVLESDQTFLNQQDMDMLTQEPVVETVPEPVAVANDDVFDLL